MSKNFRRLFEPGQIGTMQLKNRIVMPPMGTRYHDDGGYVSQRLMDYLEARANDVSPMVRRRLLAGYQAGLSL